MAQLCSGPNRWCVDRSFQDLPLGNPSQQPRLLGTEACRTWRVVGRLREGAQSPCSQPARTLRRG